MEKDVEPARKVLCGSLLTSVRPPRMAELQAVEFCLAYNLHCLLMYVQPLRVRGIEK